MFAAMRRVAALLLGCSMVSAEGDGAVELTSKTFDEEVFNSGKNAFVKFLAPW